MRLLMKVFTVKCIIGHLFTIDECNSDFVNNSNQKFEANKLRLFKKYGKYCGIALCGTTLSNRIKPRDRSAHESWVKRDIINHFLTIYHNDF